MPDEPDYKTAYETLMRAIEEANRILYRVQFMTSVGLSLQRGEEVGNEVLEELKRLNREP